MLGREVCSHNIVSAERRSEICVKVGSHTFDFVLFVTGGCVETGTCRGQISVCCNILSSHITKARTASFYIQFKNSFYTRFFSKRVKASEINTF